MASVTPPETQPTADAFLRTVLRSRLLDRDQLRQALRGVPREQRADARALADHLVRAGKLSRFQAGKLLHGVAAGLVFGPYQILAPLGKGGMGWVFLASDTRSRTLVALKVLPPQRAREEERTLARFRREMALSQKVAHPHVAWTYEVGRQRGVYYIAMEYIPGKTLARLVADEGPLPLPRAARLLGEVCQGLEHAHGRGLVHRDLKPSNIQVTPAGHAKILDLGLALISGETVVDHAVVGGQGYVVGTMDYIAPEQTTDPLRVDPRSDLYALGCTLYYALTGGPPFPGGTARDKMQHHRRDEPVALESLRPDLPAGVVALVRRLMSKNPDGRPGSALEVAGLLNAWWTAEPAPVEVEPAADDTIPIYAADEIGSSEFGAVSLPLAEAVSDEEGPAEGVPSEGVGSPLLIAVALGALALAFLLIGGLVVLALLQG